MGYPNPMTVRAVKETLYDGLKDAGMAGTVAVVNALVGTFWGTLFAASHNRDYLNFLGELAGRTINGKQITLASKIDAYQKMGPGSDGRMVIQTPSRTRGGVAINRDGTPRLNGHTYDTYPIERAGDHIRTQYRFNNSNYQKDNRNKGKKGNFSLLYDAVDEICTQPHDFAISNFFGKIRAKLRSLFTKTPKDVDDSKAVLQACFEFLDEQGYEPFPIMVDILNQQSAGNFSEVVDRLMGVDTDMERAYMAFDRLSKSEKEKFVNSLQVSCGKESTDLFMESMAQYSSGSKPRSFVIGLLKFLGVTVAALGIINMLMTKKAEKDRAKYAPPL